MKIWTFSDLHLAFSDLDDEIETPDADVCVVAGDLLSPPLSSLRWLQERIGGKMPIVFVAGNHEYYGEVYVEALAQAKAERSRFPDIHFLENEETRIDGVRFLGATLWTDFNLYGTPDDSLRVAGAFMNDYRTIMYRMSPSERLRPEHTLALHEESRVWLEATLEAPFSGQTVVVTHTCPHRLSIHPQHAGDNLNPAFTSDMTEVIDRFQPAAWIHGHTHASFDYVVPGTATRVVCNPRGYVRQTNLSYQVENMMFERYKVIEV